MLTVNAQHPLMTWRQLGVVFYLSARQSPNTKTARRTPAPRTNRVGESINQGPNKQALCLDTDSSLSSAQIFTLAQEQTERSRACNPPLTRRPMQGAHRTNMQIDIDIPSGA